jgi:phosphatidyl-myo-inositol alpha-mannosyltransferase
MKVGIVCPYSWDVPGGVQFHVRDLAEVLTSRGYEVSVLAPADDDTPLPPYVVPAGRAVPVPYNGSVARVAFGPLSAARVRRWLREGEFDLLHVHEPTTPSLSLLACWAATGAIVATFHTANLRSRIMLAAYPILEPALEKIGARIAVSEAARRTLVAHVGGDAVLIPNGVFVDRFAGAAAEPAWQGSGGTVVFIGRLDEPRKGLPSLLAAMEQVVARRPGVRLLVAGRGDADEVLEEASPAVRDAVTFLGVVNEPDKARLLHSADVYVAPNLGGESFGIVLVEAMAAGAPVLASDLDAFLEVLDDGRVGAFFPTGEVAKLGDALCNLLDDPARREALRTAASVWVRRFDWDTVTSDLLAVYETVAAGFGGVGEDVARGRFSLRGRLRGLASPPG